MKKLVVIFSLILTSIVSMAQSPKDKWSFFGTYFGLTNTSVGFGFHVGMDINKFHIDMSGRKIYGEGAELEDGKFEWSKHTGDLGFYQVNLGYNIKLTNWLTVTPKIGVYGVDELLQNYITYTYEHLKTLPNAGIDIKLMIKASEDKHNLCWLAIIGGIDMNKNTTIGLGLYF